MASLISSPSRWGINGSNFSTLLHLLHILDEEHESDDTLSRIDPSVSRPCRIESIDRSIDRSIYTSLLVEIQWYVSAVFHGQQYEDTCRHGEKRTNFTIWNNSVYLENTWTSKQRTSNGRKCCSSDLHSTAKKSSRSRWNRPSIENVRFALAKIARCLHSYRARPMADVPS